MPQSNEILTEAHIGTETRKKATRITHSKEMSEADEMECKIMSQKCFRRKINEKLGLDLK